MLSTEPIPADQAAKVLWLAECFASIQGEGIYSGTPSFFVRFTGCNLRCTWCDTPYASWNPEKERHSLGSLLQKIQSLGEIRHVVITGGEPMIANNLGLLCDTLKKRGYFITMETAGTVWKDVPVDLWSISPKMSNSTPAGKWKERHESNRLRVDVVQRMVDASAYQLKFVVSDQSDFDEIEDFLGRLRPRPESGRVLLMPQGRSIEEIDSVSKWLVSETLSRGYRFCDRLQIRLFGDTRGT